MAYFNRVFPKLGDKFGFKKIFLYTIIYRYHCNICHWRKNTFKIYKYSNNKC